MGLAWKFISPAKSEVAKVALGALCVASCIGVWYVSLGVEAQAIIDDTEYAAALKARHPLTKLFKREPKAYRTA